MVIKNMFCVLAVAGVSVEYLEWREFLTPSLAQQWAMHRFLFLRNSPECQMADLSLLPSLTEQHNWHE